MAKLLTGDDAIYEHGFCVWVTGTAPGKLKSGSFNSCVGLVLWADTKKNGAVAHFSGSMSQTLDVARQDAGDILLKIRDGSQDAQAWKAWIFGGISLREKFDFVGTRKGTLDLMAGVRGVVDKAGLKVTMQTGAEESHQQVVLDLSAGTVDWQEVQQAKDEVKQQVRRGSGDFTGKTKKPWD